MAYDYKKEYKSLYFPKEEPQIIDVPPIQFFAIEGHGNPNSIDGEYSKAVEILYALSYTVKMSYKGNNKIDGFFEYVVPPLEGLWWIKGAGANADYQNKADFQWISMIRQPEFVTEDVMDWAVQEVSRKKKIDASLAKLITYKEGLCVQIMHIGSFDDEPASISKMNKFIDQNGYKTAIGEVLKHHEIYLSDPRKCDINKMKTIIRHPIVK